MEQQYETAVRVWRYENAPKSVRRLAIEPGIEWIACIPAAVWSNEVEALFLRWHSDDHPVRRKYQPDGSVVLYGDYPASDEEFSRVDALSDSSPK